VPSWLAPPVEDRTCRDLALFLLPSVSTDKNWQSLEISLQCRKGILARRVAGAPTGTPGIPGISKSCRNGPRILDGNAGEAAEIPSKSYRAT